MPSGVKESSEIVRIAKALTNAVVAAHKLQTVRLLHTGLNDRFLSRLRALFVAKKSFSSNSSIVEKSAEDVAEHESNRIVTFQVALNPSVTESSFDIKL